MAVRRSRRRSSIRRTKVSSQSFIKVSVGGDGGALAQRVFQAATIIAEGGKADAAGFPSVQIPPSIHIGQGSASTATIYADSPNARPIALGLKHPLFGHWQSGSQYFMKQRRFLENGAVNTADEAAAVFAMVIDDWAARDGFS